MKKTKLFEVSLINKAYSRVIRDTTRFYTSDTALEVGFKLAEPEYSFDSGVVILLNDEDQSLVSRDLTREGAGFIYTLEDDIIEHYGNWAAQLKFEKDGETYVSSPVGFSIHNDLYNNRPPQLTDIRDWETLRQSAKDLISEMGDVVANEAARIEAEKQRVEGYQEVRNFIDNFEIGENAVSTENIEDNAVTLSKIDINGYLPEAFTFSRGSDPDSLGWSRAHTHVPLLKSGTVIKSLDQDYQIALFQKKGDIWPAISSWSSEINIDNDISNVSIAVRKIPDETLTPFLSYISTIIEVITDETAIKRNEANVLIDEKISKLNIDETKISDLGRPYENIIYNGLGTETIEDTKSYSDTYIRDNNILNTEIIDRNVVIHPGGYWFIRLNPSSFYGKGKLTLTTSISGEFRKLINSIRLVDSSGTSTYHYIEAPENVLTVEIPNDIDTYKLLEIRFDNRQGTNDVILDYAVANFYDKVSIQNLGLQMSGSSTESSTESAVRITKYVSLNGSDNNSGDSTSDGYATLQKALQELNGIGTIIVERGIYYGQSVNYKAKDIKILADTEAYDGDRADRQLAEFRGSDTLTGWEASNDVYRLPYSGNTRFDKVFVSKELPIETTSSRTTYNAVLWEGNDGTTDYKMKPVLTLAECQAEVGTVFYDGTHLYINPNDINNEFNAVKTDTGFSLSGDDVTMQDIVFDFYTNVPMMLYNIKNLFVQNCQANHSSTGNGFGLNYTNGTLTNCKGVKNRNDGFNMHYYGDTTLINCKGLNNYDDGVSHHEDCTGTIIGGEYSGNGKGGIIPVNGSTIQVYGAVMEDNRYGFYNESDYAVSQGNFYKGNEIAIKNLATKPLRSINDTFVGNTDTDLASNNVTTYGETIIN